MANYAAARKIKYPYIMRKKGIRNGAPVIEGTGIQVMDIAVRYHLLEHTPDEIFNGWGSGNRNKVLIYGNGGHL